MTYTCLRGFLCGVLLNTVNEEVGAPEDAGCACLSLSHSLMLVSHRVRYTVDDSLILGGCPGTHVFESWLTHEPALAVPVVPGMDLGYQTPSLADADPGDSFQHDNWATRDKTVTIT